MQLVVLGLLLLPITPITRKNKRNKKQDHDAFTARDWFSRWKQMLNAAEHHGDALLALPGWLHRVVALAAVRLNVKPSMVVFVLSCLLCRFPDSLQGESGCEVVNNASRNYHALLQPHLSSTILSTSRECSVY
uniref:Secreted protein n=1 Tax=Ixodes ricinus TaxID=34613 RepID=A0A6B0USA4_IXORI